MGSSDKERVPALATAKRKGTKRPVVKPKARRRVRSAAVPKRVKHAKKKVTKQKTTPKRTKVASTKKVKATKAKRKRTKVVSKKISSVRSKRTKVIKGTLKTRKRSRVVKKVTKVAAKKRSQRKTKVAVKKRKPAKKVSHVEAYEKRKAKFLAQIKEAKARPELKLVEPLPEPEPTVPIYKVEAGDVRGYSEAGGIEKFMHSSHANRKHPEEAVKDVFENAFIHNLKKGPFEADEVNIFRYGVVIRPRLGIATDNLTDKIREIMAQYPGSSIHVVTEGNTFSIRLNFGNNRSPELAGNVSADLQNNSGIIGDIYSLLEDRFGATDWFAFWETDDAMYE